MQKWEYLFVVGRIGKKGWVAYAENGKEIPDWKNGPALYEYVNRLGEAGWELTAAPYNASDPAETSAPILIFKREKI